MTLAKTEYKAKAKAISIELAKLAPHYFRPDFGQPQAEALFEAFVEDLSDFATCEVELAIREYRRNPANKFFPTTGQIRALAVMAAKERAEIARPRRALPDDPRPGFWWRLPFWKPHWKDGEVPDEWYDAYAHHRRIKGPPRIME